MWKHYDTFEEWLAVALLFLTAASILFSATTRAMGNPMLGGAELAQLFFIWACMFGADITLKKGGQIRVDALLTRLPRSGKWLANLVTVGLMIVFLACLARYGFSLAFSNWQRPLGFAGISYGYVTLALPVGAVMMIVSLVRRLAAVGIVQALEPDSDQQEQLL
ncbi:TRAP transporter small permease subunit [Halomonas sp. H10-59]|uniref:TRAP transporter small permease protein n=1 Tax=Halomonas sp. H10-59 TaxID=2950874 RepID=A0AAU7KR56_9GAMM